MPRVIVLQGHFFHFADLHVEEGAEPEEDEEEGEEADSGFVECDFLELSVHEQEVHKLVFYFYGEVGLIDSLSVRPCQILHMNI